MSNIMRHGKKYVVMISLLDDIPLLLDTQKLRALVRLCALSSAEIALQTALGKLDSTKRGCKI